MSSSDPRTPPKHNFAVAGLRLEGRTLLELSDEEFSWYMTNFHIWPGEHCPVLRRQADMGLAIKTTDDDIEELRTM